MDAATLLLVGLTLFAQAKEEPTPAKKYSLDLSKTTKELKSGEPGLFYLQINPAPGFKVSTEAPLKIALAAEGLKLHKTQLGAADAADKKATAPEFGVKFGTNEAGERAIKVDASFFVCDEKICERQKEQLTVAVSVKP